MSRANKLSERFRTVPSDFTWDELKAMMRLLGYEELPAGKTGGSRVKFANADKEIFAFHKPHPGNIVKKYVIKQILDTLIDRGIKL